MSTFVYSAVKRGGGQMHGEVEASSRTEAYRKLDRESLQPIKLELKEGQAGPSPGTAATAENTGPLLLTRSQIILFTEELADLLEAGLQMEPALRIMEERAELSGVQVVTSQLRIKIRDGASLSAALRDTCSSFGELYCNLIAAGEVSGSLAKILRRQASFLTTVDELQSKVIQSLIYPSFIVGAGAVLLTLFMTILVPQLTVLLNKTGQKLPLPTRVLIFLSDFLSANGWWIGILLAAGTVAFFQYVKKGEGQIWWHKAQLNLPGFGSILSMRFYTQFSWTLGTLIESGIPLLQGLRLVEGSTANRYIQGLLRKVAESVAEGAPLSRTLKRVGGFPSLFIDLVSVGEQTGDLGSALERAAKRYDKELSRKIQRVTALIQPAVIVVMALLVGGVAYSIIAGIFQTVSGLRGH